MMFSERLEYGKYDFQHLQGTARVQKPVHFREFSEDPSVWANNVGNFLSHPAIFNGLGYEIYAIYMFPLFGIVFD